MTAEELAEEEWGPVKDKGTKGKKGKGGKAKPQADDEQAEQPGGLCILTFSTAPSPIEC